MQLKVIPIEDKDTWNAYVRKAEVSDIYHTQLYHSLDTSGSPCLLVFEDHSQMMALPLIFRGIPHTNLKDVTSVYGYAGWIRTPDTFFPSQKVMSLLKEYFISEKIVSVFSRLHPLVPGSDSFGEGTVQTLNITTGIDLSIPPDEQFDTYSRSVQRMINVRKKAGMTVRMARDQQDIQQFIVIYNQAMSRLHASSHYFFPDEYFKKLWKSETFGCFILLSELEGQITGGGMFTICNDIMQYHLGAVATPYIHFSPLKLLIDEARRLANNNKCKYFHLGGGYGGHNDNLYTFKSRMTTLRYPFKVWKWIVDKQAYRQLSENEKTAEFFPLYRFPNK